MCRGKNPSLASRQLISSIDRSIVGKTTILRPVQRINFNLCLVRNGSFFERSIFATPKDINAMNELFLKIVDRMWEKWEKFRNL